ncbi:MAG: hypothetical protein RM338_08785 [Nostoc sp. DedQUE12a]|nr:hypothetical protein [Nostoc sp. DedQUE12a]
MTEQRHDEPNTHEENSVAPSPNNEQTSSESKTLWGLPLSYIASLSNDERIRLVTAITIACLVLLGSMVVTLVILVQSFDIRIDKDGLHLVNKGSSITNPSEPKPTATPTNPPEAKPTATPINPILVEPSKELTANFLRGIQKEAAEKDVFRRNWIGPDGEEISSKNLDSCLLVPAALLGKLKWGQLLTVVMKKSVSARSDPFKALNDNGLEPRNLQLVSEGNQTTLTSPDDGYLTFIINEAVYANPSNYGPESYPQPEECKRSYDALSEASKSLKFQNQNDYIIYPESIPLIWYSDNIGSFQVIVKRENKEPVRVTVESTAGFQNSGIYLKKGEKVILEADGRVHLALRQVHTFAGSVKEIIEQEERKKTAK